MIDYGAAVSNVLDAAIAGVGRDEFYRLTNGLPSTDAALQVQHALTELKKFGQGTEPGYDEWVSLFYFLWYHPKHTNLAYRMADAILRMPPQTPAQDPLGRKLHIADFGCGTLATQFGITLAVADALGRGDNITGVRIEGFDNNHTMLRLGQWLWNKLMIIVGDESPEAAVPQLRQACRMVEAINGCVEPCVRVVAGEERWLSAIHTVYEKNVPDVEKYLARLTKQMKPRVGLMTTFVYKQDLIHQASPFDAQSYEVMSTPLGNGLQGELSQVTALRHEMLKHLEDNGGLQGGNLDVFMIRNLLSNRVNWQPNSPVHLINTIR